MSAVDCEGDVHAFKYPEDMPDHIETLPDEARCECGAVTWGDMNAKLLKRWKEKSP